MHLTPRVPRTGAVTTLCGKTLLAGTYSSSTAAADCVACNRRAKDPGRVSTAFFASDEGAELLRLSLEQARFRNPTPRKPAAVPAAKQQAQPRPERPPLRPRVLISPAPAPDVPACPTCAVAVRQPATIVYRGPLVIAYVDAKQSRRGHVTVAPIRHVESILELNAPTGTELMTALIRVANAVKAAFSPVEITVLSTSAGHAQFHVLPRGRKDAPLRLPAPAARSNAGELELQALAIRERIRPV